MTLLFLISSFMESVSSFLSFVKDPESEFLFLIMGFGFCCFCQAQVHRHAQNFREVQQCTLLSIKTGGCSEDCSYCPQSSKYSTGLKAQRLMTKEAVMEAANKVVIFNLNFGVQLKIVCK